jgi:protoporphyrinogen oxidase
MSEGFAVPSFAACDAPTQRTLLDDTLRAAAREPVTPNSLAELLEQRYGALAASHLAGATRKVYRAEASELDPASIELTVFGRIALLEDAISRTLKQIPRLDSILAVRSDHDPLLFYRDRVQRRDFRNFYPSSHGMRGFCERAQALLEAHGVTILLNTDLIGFERQPGSVSVEVRERGGANSQHLHADRLMWTLGIERLASLCGHGESLAQHMHGVPMVLYYFALNEGEVGDWSYVHDFDEDTLLFRASCPSNYGRNNRPAGAAFVCCEVPTERGSSLWNDPEGSTARVWSELRALGLVSATAARAVHTLKAPSTYRVLRRGFTQLAAEFAQSLAAQDEILFTQDQTASKSRIFDSVRASLAA